VHAPLAAATTIENMMRFTRQHHVIALALCLAALAASASAQTAADRDAAAAKIAAALAEQKPEQALAAYDAYVQAAKRPDIALLRPIARAELDRTAASGNPELSAIAVERLARAGDEDRLSSLRGAAAAAEPAAPGQGLASLISLARAGDANAQAKLGARLNGAAPETKIQVIQSLQSAKATSQAPAIATLLDDPAPQVRAAAASAVGALHYREAIPQLRALYASDVPTVKMMAGVALSRLGDTTADASVTELLNSQVPEMRLMAGQALQFSKSTQWMARVKELRNDPNPVYQIRAAEIVACCDPEWSKGLLVEALGNSMGLVRMEAARVLEDTGLVDARLARRMLGDANQAIRTHGAAATLSAPAKPAPRPAR
jgi:hypothetical protein